MKVVFHDGVNIHTVAHLGRYIPAELRTALELGDPPEFDGVTCSGCAKKFNLQWDHVDPVCAGGVTSFDNEDPKCWECHAKKCDEERAAGPVQEAASRGGHRRFGQRPRPNHYGSLIQQLPIEPRLLKGEWPAGPLARTQCRDFDHYYERAIPESTLHGVPGSSSPKGGTVESQAWPKTP